MRQNSSNLSRRRRNWIHAVLPFRRDAAERGEHPSHRLFTGQTRDMGDDQLYWFKRRYLDATIGQFQSPDRAQPNLSKGPTEPRSLNSWVYGLNNPPDVPLPSPSMFAFLSLALFRHVLGAAPMDARPGPPHNSVVVDGQRDQELARRGWRRPGERSDH